MPFAFLKTSRRAIHAADQSATAITAGLAPPPVGASTIAPLPCLPPLYGLGGSKYPDAIELCSDEGETVIG